MKLRLLLAEIAIDAKTHTGKTGSLSVIKALLVEPAVANLFWYRLSRRCQLRGNTMLAKILWRKGIGTSGCYFNPNSIIEPGAFFPHATAIVIGDGCTVKCGASIYQGVTLGTNRSVVGYPTVEPGAVIFANAVVVGALTIGHNATVGAGALVLNSVPANQTVAGSPARMINKLNIEINSSPGVNE